MKHLHIILLISVFALLNMSCEKEECKNYIFNVYDRTGHVFVDYYSENRYYTLRMACSLDSLTDKSARYVIKGDDGGFGVWSFQRVCEPMFIQIESDDKTINEIKKI